MPLAETLFHVCVDGNGRIHLYVYVYVRIYVPTYCMYICMYVHVRMCLVFDAFRLVDLHAAVGRPLLQTFD